MRADLLESTAGDFGYSNRISARSARGGTVGSYDTPITPRSVRNIGVPDPVEQQARPTEAPDPVGAAHFIKGVRNRLEPHRVEGADVVDAGNGFTIKQAVAASVAKTIAQRNAIKKSALSLNTKATQQLKQLIAATKPKTFNLSPQVLKSLGSAVTTAAAHIFLRGLTKDQFKRMLKAVPALKALPDTTLTAITGQSVPHAAGLNFTRGIQQYNLARYGLGYDVGALDFTALPPVYVVESGDFPSKIAQKLTGDSSRWPELVAANPQKSKASDGNFKTLFANEKLNLPASWLPLVASQMPGGGIPPIPSIPGLPGVPGLPAPGVPSMPGPQPATGQFTYTVQTGDFASKIAQKLTGIPGKWPELVAANVPPKTKAAAQIFVPDDEGGSFQPNPNAGNFTTLNTGEVLMVPQSWNSILNTSTPGLNPPAGGSAPAPGTPPPVLPPPAVPIPVPLPGGGSVPLPAPVPTTIPPVPVPGNPATTMDPAVMASVQADLATWRKLVPGQCNPSDFGTDPSEFTGTDTPRTHQALQSFQQWYNVTHPLGQFAPGTTTVPASIRTDGTLDQMTYIALHGTVVKLLATGGPADKKKSGGGLLAMLGAAAAIYSATR